MKTIAIFILAFCLNTDRMEWLEIISSTADADVRTKLWTSFIQMLIRIDTLGQDSTIVMYLDSLDHADSKWYKITWYLDRNDTLMVDSLMSAITLIDESDSLKHDYFTNLRSTATGHGSYYVMNETIQEYVNSRISSPSELYVNLQSWLESAGIQPSSYVPEQLQIEESRFGSVTDIVSNTIQPGFTIIPNPSSGFIQIRMTPKNGEKSVMIRIFDSLGELVYEKESSPDNHYEVDISSQPPGIYLVLVQNGKDSMSEKVVLQK